MLTTENQISGRSTTGDFNEALKNALAKIEKGFDVSWRVESVSGRTRTGELTVVISIHNIYYEGDPKLLESIKAIS